MLAACNVWDAHARIDGYEYSWGCDRVCECVCANFASDFDVLSCVDIAEAVA